MLHSSYRRFGGCAGYA